MTECWQETIGKKLIKNVEVTIDDNKTKVENIDGKLKIENENEIKNKYYYLDKQTYTEIEINNIYELIIIFE